MHVARILVKSAAAFLAVRRTTPLHLTIIPVLRYANPIDSEEAGKHSEACKSGDLWIRCNQRELMSRASPLQVCGAEPLQIARHSPPFGGGSHCVIACSPLQGSAILSGQLST
jgi:hypothetical protein